MGFRLWLEFIILRYFLSAAKLTADSSQALEKARGHPFTLNIFISGHECYMLYTLLDMNIKEGIYIVQLLREERNVCGRAEVVDSAT